MSNTLLISLCCSNIPPNSISHLLFVAAAPGESLNDWNIQLNGIAQQKIAFFFVCLFISIPVCCMLRPSMMGWDDNSYWSLEWAWGIAWICNHLNFHSKFHNFSSFWHWHIFWLSILSFSCSLYAPVSSQKRVTEGQMKKRRKARKSIDQLTVNVSMVFPFWGVSKFFPFHPFICVMKMLPFFFASPHAASFLRCQKSFHRHAHGKRASAPPLETSSNKKSFNHKLSCPKRNYCVCQLLPSSTCLQAPFQERIKLINFAPSSCARARVADGKAASIMRWSDGVAVRGGGVGKRVEI